MKFSQFSQKLGGLENKGEYIIAFDMKTAKINGTRVYLHRCLAICESQVVKILIISRWVGATEIL